MPCECSGGVLGTILVLSCCCGICIGCLRHVDNQRARLLAHRRSQHSNRLRHQRHSHSDNDDIDDQHGDDVRSTDIAFARPIRLDSAHSTHTFESVSQGQGGRRCTVQVPPGLQPRMSVSAASAPAASGSGNDNSSMSGRERERLRYNLAGDIVHLRRPAELRSSHQYDHHHHLHPHINSSGVDVLSVVHEADSNASRVSLDSRATPRAGASSTNLIVSGLDGRRRSHASDIVHGTNNDNNINDDNHHAGHGDAGLEPSGGRRSGGAGISREVTPPPPYSVLPGTPPAAARPVTPVTGERIQRRMTNMVRDLEQCAHAVDSWVQHTRAEVERRAAYHFTSGYFPTHHGHNPHVSVISSSSGMSSSGGRRRSSSLTGRGQRDEYSHSWHHHDRHDDEEGEADAGRRSSLAAAAWGWGGGLVGRRDDRSLRGRRTGSGEKTSPTSNAILRATLFIQPSLGGMKTNTGDRLDIPPAVGHRDDGVHTDGGEGPENEYIYDGDYQHGEGGQGSSSGGSAGGNTRRRQRRNSTGGAVEEDVLTPLEPVRSFSFHQSVDGESAAGRSGKSGINWKGGAAGIGIKFAGYSPGKRSHSVSSSAFGGGGAASAPGGMRKGSRDGTVVSLSASSSHEDSRRKKSVDVIGNGSVVAVGATTAATTAAAAASPVSNILARRRGSSPFGSSKLGPNTNLTPLTVSIPESGSRTSLISLSKVRDLGPAIPETPVSPGSSSFPANFASSPQLLQEQNEGGDGGLPSPGDMKKAKSLVSVEERPVTPSSSLSSEDEGPERDGVMINGSHGGGGLSPVPKPQQLQRHWSQVGLVDGDDGIDDEGRGGGGVLRGRSQDGEDEQRGRRGTQASAEDFGVGIRMGRVAGEGQRGGGSSSNMLDW